MENKEIKKETIMKKVKEVLQIVSVPAAIIIAIDFVILFFLILKPPFILCMIFCLSVYSTQENKKRFHENSNFFIFF